jgi:hypothetical protein
MKIKRKRYEPKTKRFSESYTQAEYHWLEAAARRDAELGDHCATAVHARVQRRINEYVCPQLEPAAVCVGRVEAQQ